MFKDISNFFSSIWNSYIGFMSGIFGHSLAMGITIVLAFVIVCLIFLSVVNSRK